MPTQRRRLGDIGEATATEYLRRSGYIILEQNYFNKKGYRLGEIDIIAQKDDWYVFIEVKTRKFSQSQDILPPEITITKSKLSKMNRVAILYLEENQVPDPLYRFDAITITINTKTHQTSLCHKKHIFI